MDEDLGLGIRRRRPCPWSMRRDLLHGWKGRPAGLRPDSERLLRLRDVVSGRTTRADEAVGHRFFAEGRPTRTTDRVPKAAAGVSRALPGLLASIVLGLVAAESSAQTSNVSAVPTAPVLYRRNWSPLALRPDGTVVDAGGSPAQVYDPSRNVWEPSVPIGLTGGGTTVTPLPDGSLFLNGRSSAGLLRQDVAGTSYLTVPGSAYQRDEFRTVPLLDGRVLVVGGLVTPGGAAPAELFDPVTQSWSAAGLPPGGPQLGFTANRLLDGRVVVIGGETTGCDFCTGSTLSSAVGIFDPTTGAWSDGPPLPVPLEYHTTTVLDDGRVLAFGGRSSLYGLSTSLYLLDPADPIPQWTTIGPVPARYCHSAALLPDGRVAIVGGGTSMATGGLPGVVVAWGCGAGNLTREVLAIDPDSGTPATVVSSLLRNRTSTSVLVLPGGQLLVAGQDTDQVWAEPEILELSRPGWTSLPSPSRLGYAGVAATALTDGRVLFTGGFSSSGSAISGETVLYDPAAAGGTGGVVATAPMTIPRYGHTASLLPDGRVLVAGGITSVDPWTQTTSTELYDPSTGTWTAGPLLPFPYAFHSAQALGDGRVLVVGLSPATAIFDPSSSSWSTGATLPVFPTTQVYALKTALLQDGRALLVFGNKAAVFDPFPSTGPGTWHETTPPLMSHAAPTISVLEDGRALVAGMSDFGRLE